MEHFTVFVALIGVVTILASLLSSWLDRSGVPQAAVFILLGAMIGPLGFGLVDVTLDSPILVVLATLGLALVLFSDAVTLQPAELKTHRRLVLVLLGPGTVLPAIVTALAAWLLLDLPASHSVILGAALASTDPVLLRPLIRSRTLPAQAETALRVETGMNDIVLLPIVVLAMTMGSGDGEATGTVIQSAMRLFLIGPVVGAVVAWLGIAALVRARHHGGVRRDFEALYSIALAFVAYAAAEAMGGSGFVAAFVAGLLVTTRDVELCDCFVEYGEATSLMLLLLTLVALGTSLIWTGVEVATPGTLAVAAIALGIRTVVLLPILAAAGIRGQDRSLIALFGPRGMSSLLLVLLPVFAGMANAEGLFSITCLAVLISIVVHGSAAGWYQRSRLKAGAGFVPPWETGLTRAPNASAEPPERITVPELQELWQQGEPVVMADVRAERGYREDSVRAAGAVRLSPDSPVADATALRLERHGTLVLYCA